MIDDSLRRSLSENVRRLVTGRMTNDAFDDVYYESYDLSEDRAIREIAAFCYSLYSSDVLWPYRLRGRHAVNKETRTAAARCVLFLRSGRDYEWPPMPSSLLQCIAGGLLLNLGVPAGVALSFCWISAFIDGWDSIVGSCAILGTLLLALSVAGLCYPQPISDDWRAYYQAGDFDVWPFLRRRDFDDAGSSCHLLGFRHETSNKQFKPRI